MEDDIDIYEDLPNFEPKDCQADKELAEECSKLREENTKLKGDVAKLGANISSLMKTAKAEIARKDKMIAQLRQELDNAAFRRGNFSARRKQNINNPRAKQFQQNAGRERQTPPLMKEEPSEENTAKQKQAPPVMKEEPLQEYAATELDDVSDEDMDTPVPTELQNKLTSTVFGARLKKKLMLEQEAAKKQKGEASVAVLEIPVKVEEAGNTELGSGSDIVKKEDPEDASHDTSRALTPKTEVPDTSSLPQSTASSSQTKPVDDINPYHRRAPKRDLTEKRDFSTNPEQHKRRRIEEDKYRRDEDARQHHNGNFKYDDVRYNFENFEKNDCSKSSMKYTDSRYMDRSRGDYYRGHDQVRGGRSKPMYRSNGSDPRYFDRRPDRHWMEESRIYNEKYDKRREDGSSREGDNNWMECSRKIDDLRDKVECRVGGRSEYNNYNSRNRLDWNLKRLGRKSRSPEAHRSRSTGRRSRENEFERLRPRSSKSTDKFINAMSTVDERESGQEPQSTHAGNSKDFEAAVRNNRDAQPKDSHDFSRIDSPNEMASDKISSEIRESCLLLCTERPGHVDTENVESLGRPLEKLVSQMETSEKHKNHRSRRTSREKELDKLRSKKSKSIDKCINATSTLDQRESGQERQSTPAKDSEDFKAKVRNSRDDQPGVPSDCSRNSPPNEVATDKISLSEIVQNDAIVCTKGPGHVDTENVESLGRALEKLVSHTETSEKQRSQSIGRSSREKELDKPLSRTSKSTDKLIDAMSTVDERDSEEAKDFEAKVRNRRDAQPTASPNFPRNDPPNEAAPGKISSSENAENGLLLSTERPVHVDTENAKSAGLPVEKLVSQMETSEKHRSHSNSKRSREKDFDKRRSKTSRSTDKSINAMSTIEKRESGQEHQNTRAKNAEDHEVEVRNSRDAQPEIPPDCSRNDPANEMATAEISSSKIEKTDLLLCTEGPGRVDIVTAQPAGLPLEKLVSQIESSEKHRSDSSRRKSTEKELDKRRSKTSKSTDKFINAMSKVDERESGQEHQNARATDSKDFEVEVRNSRDTQPENPPDCSRKSPSNEVVSSKISTEIAEKGSPRCTEGPVHVDVENAELARLPLEKLVSKIESSEKHRSHSSRRKSTEKELDKRRSKTSKSTDKFINAMSKVDEREFGQEHQNARAKDSENFEVEVRNSRDTLPEIPPDCLRNSPPNDAASDKMSSSENAEKGPSRCTEKSVHVDIENAELAGVPPEKLVSQIQSSEKHRSHSRTKRSRDKESDRQRSKTSKSTDKVINSVSPMDERESGQEHQNTRAKDSENFEVEVKNSREAQPEVPPDCSRNSPPNDVASDKISSSENAEKASHTDVENAALSELPLGKLVNREETSEKHKSHSSRRRSTEKEFDKRRSKTSKSADKFINAMSKVDERESSEEHQNTQTTDSKDVDAEVRNSRDTQPKISSDVSKNDPPNEVTTDKVSSSETVENRLLLSTEGSVNVDKRNAESAELPLEKLVNRVETSEKHKIHSSRRRSTEKELDKRRSKTSKSTDKHINAMSTVDERESGQEHQNTRSKGSKDFEVEVRNNRDAQPEVPPDCSRNSPPNEVAPDKISSEIAKNGLLLSTDGSAHVDTGKAESTRPPLEKLVNRVETSEKHKSHSNSKRSREKESDKRQSKTTVEEQESAQESQSARIKDSKDFEAETRNSCDAEPQILHDPSTNSSSNKVTIEKISSIEVAEKGLPSGTDCTVHVDLKNAESAGLPVEKLVNQVQTSEKHESHSSRIKSAEKEFDNRRSKTSTSTDKFINPMRSVDEQGSGQERQSTRIKDSKDFEAEAKNSRDSKPEIPLDSSRNSSSNEVAIEKNSSSEIAEKGSPSCTDGLVHVDNKNIESTGKSVEKLVNRVETSEKQKTHRIRRSSREKDFDNRRSKTSRCTDKFINPISTVDEQESGQQSQSTSAKGSKGLKAEVRNSQDGQPEVSSDSLRNRSPNEAAIDKNSSSEIAEKSSPTYTESPVRVDNKNAESAGKPMEKLVNRVETSEKHKTHSIRRSSREKDFDNRRSKTSRCPDKFINPISTVDDQESGQAPQSTSAKGSKDLKAEVRNSQDGQPEVPSDSVRNSSPNEVSIDKISSSEIAEKGSPTYTQSPIHVDNKNSESAEKPVEKLVNLVETLEKRKTHSIRRSSREKDSDNRQSKTSRSTDKFIKPMRSGAEQESDQERESSRIKDSKDFGAEVSNSRVAQPENLPDISRNAPPNETATDKVSSNEIAEKGSPLCTEEPINVDIDNADSAGQPVENLVSQMETPDVSIAELEKDSEIASIQSATPEPAALGSGSFREEKIENIEKFINDYKENEEPCLPVANTETNESEKVRLSTSSIVDTLTMDVEESAAHPKSDNAPTNPPHESRTNTKDVAEDTESTIPKSDITIAETTSSEQIKTLCEKQISPDPEISETKPNVAKYETGKIAIVKLKKYQPRIPCVTTLSSYPRRKPSVWADSGSSSRIVKSRPSTNTGADNKSKKVITTRRVTMETSRIIESIENITKKSDSKILIAKKQIEGTTLSTGKNDKTSDTAPPKTTNPKDDSRPREDADCKVESSENNSASVSSSTSNFPPQQTKTNPQLSEKSDAAPKLNNAHESVEVRETRFTGKSILAEALTADSKPSNRKRALPKEVDSQTNTSPELSDKVDAAPKLNNAHDSVEVRETRLSGKSILAEVLTTDSKSSNRKKALPKEVDNQTNPAAKTCKIVVTARRRRNMQLEDSCIATTLVPSVHDVNSNESVKTVSVNSKRPELPDVVSEPAIKRRKRRSNDK